MGCSVSRPDGVFTKNTIQPSSSSPSSSTTATTTTTSVAAASSIPRTISLPTPLVHHFALRKGDTHHLVSLTSTTYGSLRLLDNRPTTTTPTNPKSNDRDRPNNTDKTQILDLSPDSVINTWELMAGLDDFDYSASALDRSFNFDSSTSVDAFNKSSYPSLPHTGSVKKLCDSFESARSSPVVDEKVKRSCNAFESSAAAAAAKDNSLSKPLWKHLSEESLLADMDPNVVSSFRRALSSRQLGFNQSKMTRPLASGARVSPLFDNRIRLPGTEDKIVLYFTSLRGIRRTYEDCCAVRTIFRGFRVPVDERDISMDSAYRRELQSVLGDKTVTLPQVFIRGKYVGGADEIKQLHEVGDLAKLLVGFPVRDFRFVCECCGDARFVPCSNCNGSRKVFEEEKGQLRRCPDCNENGLIRCPICCF